MSPNCSLGNSKQLVPTIPQAFWLRSSYVLSGCKKWREVLRALGDKNCTRCYTCRKCEGEFCGLSKNYRAWNCTAVFHHHILDVDVGWACVTTKYKYWSRYLICTRAPEVGCQLPSYTARSIDYLPVVLLAATCIVYLGDYREVEWGLPQSFHGVWQSASTLCRGIHATAAATSNHSNCIFLVCLHSDNSLRA